MSITEQRLKDYQLQMSIYAEQHNMLLASDVLDMIEQLQDDLKDDVDKVVKQLEEERELSYADFDRYVEEVSQCLDAEYDDFFHRGLERAIKIVKGGGVDADGI